VGSVTAARGLVWGLSRIVEGQILASAEACPPNGDLVEQGHGLLSRQVPEASVFSVSFLQRSFSRDSRHT
jgi:hypothetical protein